MNIQLKKNGNNVDLQINEYKVNMDYLHTHNIVICHKEEDIPNFIDTNGVQVYTLDTEARIDECMNFITSYQSTHKVVVIYLKTVSHTKIKDILSSAPFNNTNVILFLDINYLVTDYIVLPFADDLNNPVYIGGIIAVKFGNTEGYLNSEEICIEN